MFIDTNQEQPVDEGEELHYQAQEPARREYTVKENMQLALRELQYELAHTYYQTWAERTMVVEEIAFLRSELYSQ